MTTRRALPASLTMLLAIFRAASGVHSQSSVGGVRGTVQDKTGAVIPNATILLTNTEIGVQQKAESNDAGI